MTASDPQPPGERSLADLALDVFVYGPAGVLLTAASDMPAMAAKGRERIEQELKNAHVVGRFVVDAGMRQLRGPLGWLGGAHAEEPSAPGTGTVVAPVRSRTRPSTRPAATPPAAGGAAPFTGSAATRPAPAPARPPSGTAVPSRGAPVPPPPESGPAVSGRPGVPGRPGAPARDAAVDRAIPDYDTLSASQVVRRLDGLKPRELRAIVRHELANRGRRTILHRAEQLLGGPPPAPPSAPA